MKTWVPAIAVGGVLALIALAVVSSIQPGSEPTAADRADALARELRCPDCQGLSVADAPTASAQEIRRQIDELVADGATADEVRAHFTARYGEWILLAPSAPWVWIIPFAVVVTGAGILGAWLVSRRRPEPPLSAAQPTASDRRRLHEEVEALDA
ncbi:MAG: cytochrome c-type biogenesis protein [Candidatus Limnocylindria bacterium]